MYDFMLLINYSTKKANLLGHTSMQVCLLSGDEGIRTLDLRVANASLSQLSHAPRSSKVWRQRGSNP